jgi:hypothetical protein
MLGKSRYEGRDQNRGIQKNFHRKAYENDARRVTEVFSEAFHGTGVSAAGLLVCPGVQAGTVRSLSAEMLGHVEVLLGELSGVNQKLHLPSEWGPLFLGPESDSSPVSFFRLNAYFESSPRINTEVISDFFWNDNSTVIVDLYFHGDELLGLSYANCHF